jgi:hypothetical protein
MLDSMLLPDGDGMLATRGAIQRQAEINDASRSGAVAGRAVGDGTGSVPAEGSEAAANDRAPTMDLNQVRARGPVSGGGGGGDSAGRGRWWRGRQRWQSPSLVAS